MNKSVLAASALADVLRSVFGPHSGDIVIEDESGKLVVTSSGLQVLVALTENVKDNPVATIILRSAVVFGRSQGLIPQ
jgi:chaperonin GroEL (HSP60 family)